MMCLSPQFVIIGDGHFLSIATLSAPLHSALPWKIILTSARTILSSFTKINPKVSRPLEQLIFTHPRIEKPGFPFDFAQGGELVEPRISSRKAAFVRNDGFRELRHSRINIEQSEYVAYDPGPESIIPVAKIMLSRWIPGPSFRT
jgi:hypothetical protein